jgi:hypothetical protein
MNAGIASNCLADWVKRLWTVSDPTGSALQRIYTEVPPQAVARGTLQDFERAGFRTKVRGPGPARFASSAPGHLAITVEFSERGSHQAILLRQRNWAGALLWVDALPIPVPLDESAMPLAETIGQWLDDRYFAVQVGLGRDHPKGDPATKDRLGDIRGLLICDAVARRSKLELPTGDDAWHDPKAALVEGRIRIYAGAQEQRRGLAARDVDW